MRGYIKKRGKSSYALCVYLGRDAVTGKVKQHWTSVRGTRAEAERQMVKLQQELLQGTFVKPEKVTVGEFLLDWLENTARLKISPTTYRGYEYILRAHLIPGLGSYQLSALTGAVIQKYYAEKLRGARLDHRPGTLSARSVRTHHLVLHRALRSAVTRRLIPRNVSEDTEPPVPQDKEMRPMTEGELQRFLKELRGSEYYEVLYTSLFTGLRRSELLALRWEDIDLQNGYLSVKRVMHQIKGRVIFCDTKTKQSRATISLSPSNAAVLQNYKQRRVGEGIMLGRELRESDLAFAHYDGTPLLPHTISQYWRRFVNRIGMKGIRLHDARHTHATLMIKHGVNIKVVQERLRHARVETTLGVYSHVLPGMQEEAAKIFDELAAG